MKKREKPLKYLKAKERSRRRKRKESILPPPPYTYIVTEGEKTEPNYIKGFTDKINKKYYDYGSSDRVIVVEGVGRGTKMLFQYAKENIDKKCLKAEKVYIVYDKDNFEKYEFDNVEKSIEKEHGDGRKYHAIWSNECVELFFALHFQVITSGDSDKYNKILKNNIDYEKNMKDLHNKLFPHTKDAIKRARKQYEGHDENKPAHKKCPATKMFLLVEELSKYLD